MEIDISPLNYKDYMTIDETYSFTNQQLQDSEIIKMDNIRVTGTIFKNSLNECIMSIDINGIMILPCSITLNPVAYPFNCKIEESLTKIAKKSEKNKKTIDILPIIWENILMEIPIKIVSENLQDLKTSGEGWNLITED
jgi:uncharacterized protein